MKLRVGEYLIETDHIEIVEWISQYNVKIYFVSGETLDVVCGIKTTAPANWDQDADAFIQMIQNTDFARFPGVPPQQNP